MNKGLFVPLLLTSMFAFTACSKPSDTTESTLEAEESPQETASSTEDPLGKIKETTTLQGIIDLTKPHMEDGINKIPFTAMAIPLWAQSHTITLADITALPSTTYGKIMKNSSAESGKHQCISGIIIEIEADNSAGFTIYHGGMLDSNYHVTRFLAIKSTGELVAQSDARFCGVVNGKMSYDNAAGGSTNAPYLVGMFDLPENK